MRPITFCILLLASLSAVAVSGGDAPQATVRTFYATLAKPQPDWQRQLHDLEPMLSGGLNALLRRALAADDAYRRKFPDDAPPFEHGSCVFYGGGDCAFTGYRLIRIEQGTGQARITVELSLTDEQRPAQPPVRWRNTVTLARMTDGRWLIDEIQTPDGKTSDSLQAIVRAARASQNP